MGSTKRVLLDTNIIIYRENKRITNYSIGHLFRWLDDLKYDKLVHPSSVEEIQKYKDPETKETINIKLESYNKIKTIKDPDEDFLKQLPPEKTENDTVDDYLLYEVYLGRVDLLITEDRKLIEKDRNIGLESKVFSINAFISKCSGENPELIEYHMLAVKKIVFGEVDLRDNFFDSLRSAYVEFDRWFTKKCDEEAYICQGDKNKILGFLYLKSEDKNENYSDIQPPFEPKLRLKVGTFKVESTGFRLGERFIKIIFDNAIERNVEEIYVTIPKQGENIYVLKKLLIDWGFKYHGIKKSGKVEEDVYTKNIVSYDIHSSVRENFPNIKKTGKKWIIPIRPQYHTALLPDSKLKNENEIDFLGRDPHKYALQKIYISWVLQTNARPGDLVLFYRMGEENTIKGYTSVLTTLSVIEEIKTKINTESELLDLCQNRSVFTTEELKDFWLEHKQGVKVLKFIYVKSLTVRLNLNYLWEKGIIAYPNGPRPFTEINDEQFEQILTDSKTTLRDIDK